MTTSLDFLVGRRNLHETRFAEAELAPLRAGQALLAVDRFGFTSNNLSYATFGEEMRYWDFFPAPEEFGRVPVWGFAEVVASANDDVTVGERVFGYLPMSTHLVVQASRATPSSFTDAAPHRRHLAAPYNQYRCVSRDPSHTRDREDHQALLRPLFMPAFLADDFLAEHGWFGARQVLVSSASSKTALGVAFLTRVRGHERPDVVGLTSSAHVGFALRTRCYDRVHAYDEMASLARDTPTVFVDMAGNAALLAAVHDHFREGLAYSCSIGFTHRDQRGTVRELPGPKPTFFFAPDRIKKRQSDWGARGVEEHYAEAWKRFLPSADRWMTIVHGSGRADVERVYRALLTGNAKAEEAHVLSL